MSLSQTRQADNSEIISRWPSVFNLDESDSIPAELIGAKILAIGTTEEDIEGGGLVIEFLPNGVSHCVRLTLAFTELGMCVWRREIVGRVSN